MTIANPPPFTLVNATTADATQVMANFNQLVANVNANAAANGANSDITSLTGLTTPLGRTYGGSQFYVGGTSTGSANAHVVATATPNGFSLFAGAMVAFVSGFNNSAATTLNVAGSGVKNVFRQTASGAVACVGGEIKTGQFVVVIYDGTQYQILNETLSALLTSFQSLTLTTGDLIYANGAGTVTQLDPGAANTLLQCNGAAAPSWTASPTLTTVTASTINATTDLQFNGTSVPLLRRFQGSFVTWSSGGLITQAHGLGTTPRLDSLNVLAQNVSGGVSNGWAANDIFVAPSWSEGTSVPSVAGTALYADATNVYCRVASGGLFGLNKTTGASFVMTSGTFNLALVAYA